MSASTCTQTCHLWQLWFCPVYQRIAQCCSVLDPGAAWHANTAATGQHVHQRLVLMTRALRAPVSCWTTSLPTQVLEALPPEVCGRYEVRLGHRVLLEALLGHLNLGPEATQQVRVWAGL
jgi:hypothetical protein